MFFNDTNDTNDEIPSISINTNNEENINSRDNVKYSIKIEENNEIMQKLDYIISEIKMMKTEIREIKRMQQHGCTTFVPNYPPPPNQNIYPVNPSFPGQLMPPYPYQLSGNSNLSKNQFM
jgi:hypothetical protein